MRRKPAAAMGLSPALLALALLACIANVIRADDFAVLIDIKNSFPVSSAGTPPTGLPGASYSY